MTSRLLDRRADRRPAPAARRGHQPGVRRGAPAGRRCSWPASTGWSSTCCAPTEPHDYALRWHLADDVVPDVRPTAAGRSSVTTPTVRLEIDGGSPRHDRAGLALDRVRSEDRGAGRGGLARGAADAEFVTLLAPRRAGTAPRLRSADASSGSAVVELPDGGTDHLRWRAPDREVVVDGLRAAAETVWIRTDRHGAPQRIALDRASVVQWTRAATPPRLTREDGWHLWRREAVVSSPVRAAVDLAPDPVLPRRDDLLDDRVVGARLGELLDRAWGDGAAGDCTRVRAKYRLGESLRATYRVGPDGGRRLVSARMFPAAKAATQFLRARDVADGAGCRPAVGAVRRGDQHRLLGLPAGPQARRPRPADRPATRAARRLRRPLDAERADGLHAGEGGHRAVHGLARRDGRLREAAGRGRRPPQRRHPARSAARHRRARHPAAARRGRVPARAAPGAVLAGTRSPAAPARPEPRYRKP